jgi:hypothetical protein
MDVINKVRSLCTPAFVFFVISIISVLVMMFENIQNTNTYCFGNVSCDVANTSMIFIVKILTIIAWTWLLDVLCGKGYEKLAWFILLFPYILFLIVVLFIASEIRKVNNISKDSIPIIETLSTPGYYLH